MSSGYEDGTWVTSMSRDEIERMADRETIDMAEYTPEDVEALVSKLVAWGLKEWEVQVLLEKDINKLTLAEIADTFGYTDAKAVLRIYRMASRKAKMCYAAKGYKS